MFSVLLLLASPGRRCGADGVIMPPSLETASLNPSSVSIWKGNCAYSDAP